VAGKKGSYSYPYVKAVTYDKFEQRLAVQQGNNAVTTYRYDPLNRRLSGLKANAAGSDFMDLTYRYDDVGNILALSNAAAAPGDNAFGGITQFSFGYDELYRLTASSGRWTRPGNEHTYSLSMAYDDIHNITKKTQNHLRISDEGDWIRQHKTSYDFAYAYTGGKPHAPTHIGGRSFTYDLNGNQTGWVSDQGNTRRIITWDEENRIHAIEDNGQLLTYKYNDAGERVFKTGPQGETVYLNQFFSVANREGGSKHIFVGATRVATKLVKGQENVTTPSQGLPPGQVDNPNSNSQGNGPAGNNGGGSGGQSPGNGTIVYEPDVFYYHSDHLGSIAYVTDLSGQVYQHLEYFPFGETWVEEVSNRWRVPYLFTAKELDRETGLYYFGARYYDPRTSVWQSADPIIDRYLDGKRGGGVFHTGRLASFSYANNNPLKYVDRDGEAFETLWDLANVAMGACSLASNLAEGNWGSAAIDAGGLILDIGAAVVPFVPGGAGTAIKVGRLADKGADVARQIGNAADTGRKIAPKNTKGFAQQADDLIPLNQNRNRVTLRSEKAQMDVDLTGAPHAGIETPHTKISQRNFQAPEDLQPAYNTSTKKANYRPATQQDIRTVRRYLERQNR